MSPAAAFAACGALLIAAALYEMSASRPNGPQDGGRIGRWLRQRGRMLAMKALPATLPERLLRAGLEGRVAPAMVLASRAFGAVFGLLAGAVAAPAAPGRLSWLVIAGMPVAGTLAPDALLERTIRRRRERLVASLPDALDLLAVSAAAGRSAGAGFADVAAAASGPLATELAAAVEEISCGRPQELALGSLRQRVGGSELAALVAAIERSRRYGSPLADQLRRQASALRISQHRVVEERAARAAPKIQLVVALVLVPSVLLMIAAGLIANADVLLGGF